ncbi:unnamed protein product [Caenorhabditis angaria]|uniref:Uncharacterized protein n=1 Tax=Caenorhabditis angaria TaxID=860376 RepID=A0A9P1N9T1_9PELO|nr:unnamed protein product [Caenorhabditis angaria]
MSRPIPTLRRKEIIYKKTFVDTHNSRVDRAIEKPFVVLRRNPEYQERPASVIIRETIIPEQHYVPSYEKQPVYVQVVKDQTGPLQNYSAPKDVLYEINSKLDNILEQIENKTSKKTKKQLNTNEELENEKNNKDGVPQVIALNETVGNLTKEHLTLKEKLNSSNFVGQESIDEILKVINDTRLDIEEKISNLKQLSDGNWIHLDDKIDSFERTQNGIQVQINELMKILTSLYSSRSSSTISRTARSRSDSTLVETICSSKKNKEVKNIPETPRKSSTPKYIPQDNTEVLKLSPELPYEPIWEHVNSPDVSEATSSMIAPLNIDERRASHVANVKRKSK